jgi:rhomboid protease GluP
MEQRSLYRVGNLIWMAPIIAERRTVTVLIFVCVAVEASLLLADWGWIDYPRLRQTAYENGGFWPGLLRDWRPNFTGQWITMFLTYGFLHGGLLHLVFNMATLWSLSGPVVDRVGSMGFGALYAVTAFGGAIGYYLLNAGFQPMVGASGALFGLAGALIAWNYIDRFSFQRGLLPVLQAVIGLILMNFVLWWVMDGRLAWETHLGGFVTGWLFATVIDPRPQA